MALSFEARRTNNGITLERICQETKISKRMLQAIENGDFSKLPGGIYSTAYIRQYAELARIDEQEVLEVYEKYVAAKLGKAAEESDSDRRSVLGRLSTVTGS